MDAENYTNADNLATCSLAIAGGGPEAGLRRKTSAKTGEWIARQRRICLTHPAVLA